MEQYKATPIVKNKFWIVEKNGVKVATIQTTPTGVAFVKNQQREKFVSINLLKTKYNIEFVDAGTKKKPAISTNEVNGFPCESKPFNGLIDAVRGIAIYTKTKNSKSFYCAGHFMIKIENEFIHTFCPKLITLNRHEFLGPFHSKADAILSARR